MSAAERVASMSPDELIAVVTRGLDADEQTARAASTASATPWHLTSEQDDFDGDALISYTVLRDADGLELSSDRDDFGEEELRHIARHDPSRVLADVESKREILALHPYTTQRRSVGEGRLAAMYGRNWEKRLKNLDTPYCETCHVEDGVIDGGGPCDTLIALARPYLTQNSAER